jgi:transposase-like protein
MSTPPFIASGQACMNPSCPKFENPNAGNMQKNGTDAKCQQRHRCKICKKVTVETKGTVMYRLRSKPTTVESAVSMSCRGMAIEGIAVTLHLKPKTISRWINRAGCHAKAIEEVLLADHQAGPTEVDGKWNFIKNKGEKSGKPETDETGTFWAATPLEIKFRLRLGYFIAKTEKNATIKAFINLRDKQNMESPPPLVSDGHNGCEASMLEVWGKPKPYRGRGPIHLKIIKFRSDSPSEYRREVVFGNKSEVLAELGNGTVHVERTHLTQRTWSSRLTRKTICFSKNITMHQAAGDLSNAYFNLCFETEPLRIPLFNTEAEMKSVGKFQPKWQHRTPMMAANLTDRKWSVMELLTTKVLKSTRQLLRA